jgi:hypothetical protein
VPLTARHTVAAALSATLLLLSPGAARAFTIEDVHFAEPAAGLSDYAVSFTILPNASEEGSVVRVALVDQDSDGPGILIPLAHYAVEAAGGEPLPIVDARVFKVTCRNGKVQVDGKSTGEAQAELALSVWLEDPAGNSIGEARHAGDLTVSCGALQRVPGTPRRLAPLGPPEPASEVRSHVHAPRRTHRVADRLPFAIVVWDGTRHCERRQPTGRLYCELLLVRPDGSVESVFKRVFDHLKHPRIVRVVLTTDGWPPGSHRFRFRVRDRKGRTISEGHHYASLDEES